MDLQQMGKDAFKFIADKAPFIGTALGTMIGGPGGGAVGSLAGNVLKKFFGVESDDPKILAEAIQQDPQAAAKLAMAELEFKIEFRKLDVDETRAFLADVQSARGREIEVTKATGKLNIHVYILAWVIIGGFLGIILGMLILQYIYGKTLASDPMLSLLVGSLATDAGMVVGYFFGSSLGSFYKTQDMMQAKKETK